MTSRAALVAPSARRPSFLIPSASTTSKSRCRPKRGSRVRPETTAPVAYPRSRSVPASVRMRRLKIAPLRRTPCEAGCRPVMIEAWAGRVRGIGVYASARTPCSASRSSTAVRASPRPEAPSASARRVSIVIRTTRVARCRSAGAEDQRGEHEHQGRSRAAASSCRSATSRTRFATTTRSDLLGSPANRATPGIRRARVRECDPIRLAVSPSIQHRVRGWRSPGADS